MTQSFNSKSSIIIEIQKVGEEVISFANTLSQNQFIQTNSNKWSVADNMVHLIRSIKPLHKILNRPKVSIRVLFGKANRPSRTYEDLIKKYTSALQTGPVTNNPFGPKKDIIYDRDRLVQSFTNHYQRLATISVKWSEAQLDDYILPHPLIGKLTIREMLYFTHYHTLHHLDSMRVSAG